MKKDRITPSEMAQFLEESRGLERNLLEEIITSRKKAWRVATMAGVLAAASIGAVIGLTPLKAPPEMYVVRVDKASGAIDHATRLGVDEQDYGERIDKYFLNQYILNCEGYNWFTIQQQHDTCALLSSTDVQREYGKRFDGEKGLTQRLANHTNIDVTVHSITLGANNTATVRFTKAEKDVTGLRPGPIEHRIATIAYHYINVPITEEIGRRNPLGFQVIRYRDDADL